MSDKCVMIITSIYDPVDLVPSPKQTTGGDFFENSSKKVTFNFSNPNVDHMYPF